MKKSFKIYAWAWAALVVITILSVVLLMVVPFHHDFARDPYGIEQIVDVDLPDIASVESENNMNRGTSRWDVYDHTARFSENLSEECIAQLDDLCRTDSLHWQKNTDKGYYLYSDSGGMFTDYSVSCFIYNDHFSLTYEVDEDEGLFVIAILFLVYQMLIIWGIVLLAVAIIRKVIKKRKER